ncbi:hypothetical protein MC885_011531 [Smutsia gigantea]|nr:hypothetical protein MC885_011531 [Smutsia gigantea]
MSLPTPNTHTQLSQEMAVLQRRPHPPSPLLAKLRQACLLESPLGWRQTSPVWLGKQVCSILWPLEVKHFVPSGEGEFHSAEVTEQREPAFTCTAKGPGSLRAAPGKHVTAGLFVQGLWRGEYRGFGQSNSLPTAGSVGGGMGRRNPRQYQIPSRNVPSARLGLLGTSGFVSSTQRNTAANPTIMKQGRQNLWFANPGGSNSMPSRTHSSVQRTRSLPVHTSPQNMLMFQQPEFQLPVTEPDINNRLESLCLSMTEHALGEPPAQGTLGSHRSGHPSQPPGAGGVGSTDMAFSNDWILSFSALHLPV